MRISSLRLSVFAALLLLISPAVHAQGVGDLFPNFSFQYGDGGLPAGIDSSVSQLTSPDGQSVKLSGECGPITGDQYAPGFGLSWSGPYDGQMNPGDTFTADLDLSVSATGG
ncbi:MAG TPA: hypothetical protein VKK61_05250, partial [Tepidisphaeraceae bacterium]|nr:hypothetical protein [Tepidisphaeraceae bacterium]